MLKMNFRLKLVLCSLLLSVAFSNLTAQVTIGSQAVPNVNALLDLKENVGGVDGSSTKGFLPPRVALTNRTNPGPMASHVEGLVVYNTATTELTTDNVFPGFYYSTGEKWERLLTMSEHERNATIPKFFYLPSVPINTSFVSADAEYTLNLYNVYIAQYATPAVSSPDAPTPSSLLNVAAATDFYYYVLDYDEETFNIGQSGISTSGVLTYKLKKESAATAFINILLVVK